MSKSNKESCEISNILHIDLLCQFFFSALLDAVLSDLHSLFIFVNLQRLFGTVCENASGVSHCLFPPDYQNQYFCHILFCRLVCHWMLP